MTMRRFFLTRALAMAGIALLLVVGAVGAARAAPTLIVDASGELLGADGVDVGGTLYDVRFVDGTCTQAYGSCDVASFAFTTETDAKAASKSLLAQVFVGQFDAAPNLTAGCNSVVLCAVFTAYLAGADGAAVANNRALEAEEFVGGSVPGTANLALDPFSVWAVWTLATANPVPEPASLLLAGSALGLMGLASRRSRPRAARPQPLAG